MKRAPPLSQQPHFISWGPVKPPPIENLIGGSIPLFPAASDVIISFKGSCIFLLDTKKKEKKKWSSSSIRNWLSYQDPPSFIKRIVWQEFLKNTFRKLKSIQKKKLVKYWQLMNFLVDWKRSSESAGRDVRGRNLESTLMKIKGCSEF